MAGHYNRTLHRFVSKIVRLTLFRTHSLKEQCMADTVKYGLQISFTHRPDEIVKQAVRAEHLGFDSIWLGEHFFRPGSLESVDSRDRPRTILRRVSRRLTLPATAKPSG